MIQLKNYPLSNISLTPEILVVYVTRFWDDKFNLNLNGG